MESQDFQTTDTQACDEIIIDDWMSCLPINTVEDSIQPIPWEIQLEENDNKVNEACSNSQEEIRTQRMMAPDDKLGTFNESRGQFDSGIFLSNDNPSHFQLERDVLQDENTSAVYSLTSHSRPMQKADKIEEEVVPRNDACASAKVELHGNLNARMFPSAHSEFKNGISCVEKASAKLSFDEDGDGYNWRKYGQKHVKETNCPRSYYRCTFPGCSAKKQLEKSKDGVVLDVIRRGQHNHPPVRGSLLASRKFSHYHHKRFHQGRCTREDAVSMPASDQKRIKVFKESYEDTCWPVANQMYDDSPREKQKIVQTRTEDNVISDGYRWRKYGQKLVKGSAYPRSYYRCTSSGCKVRKHSERSKDNPRILVTTYDGEHNHPMPGTFGTDEECKRTVSTETESKIKAGIVKINDTCTATPRKLEDPVKSAVILAETFFSQQGPCYDFEEIFPVSLVARPLELPLEVSLPDEGCMLHLMDSEFSNTWMTVPENRWKPVENIDAFAMLREPLTPVL